MTRQTWDIGALFAVPLADGSHACGQVIGREREVLNSVTCAFYRTRTPPGASPAFLGVPGEADLLAVQFVTPDLLTSGVWPVLATGPVALPRRFFPHEDKRRQGWVGAKVIGSGIMVRFLNAFFGLEPWDQMKDPQYFDRLLVRPDLRPSTARTLP